MKKCVIFLAVLLGGCIPEPASHLTGTVKPQPGNLAVAAEPVSFEKQANAPSGTGSAYRRYATNGVMPKFSPAGLTKYDIKAMIDSVGEHRDFLAEVFSTPDMTEGKYGKVYWNWTLKNREGGVEARLEATSDAKTGKVIHLRLSPNFPISLRAVELALSSEEPDIYRKRHLGAKTSLIVVKRPDGFPVRFYAYHEAPVFVNNPTLNKDGMRIDRVTLNPRFSWKDALIQKFAIGSGAYMNFNVDEFLAFPDSWERLAK